MFPITIVNVTVTLLMLFVGR